MNMPQALVIGVLVVVVLLGGPYLYLRWWDRSLRPDEPGFPYVLVNNRGRVRELCAEERAYLNQKFDPFDGARPAIIWRYHKLDAFEFERGFIERRRLPPNVDIIELTRDEDLHTSDQPISLNQAVFEDRCPDRR
ncbi:MAG TPA: hypothetical protein VER96_29055 [Polyangiaceae bacterium]|nr:hypothetical protein [Polyangiaceae bacterium]